jgi:seryl-tRNA synthetase
MSLDIELFRAEKGGNPEEIRKSQRARFKPVELVDEVIALDEQWRKGLYLSNFSILQSCSVHFLKSVFIAQFEF